MAEPDDPRSETIRPFAWSKQRERAALLLAEDELTDIEIGRDVGVDDRTLRTWKKHPAFLARIAEHARRFEEAAQRYRIAKRRHRMERIDSRWRAIHDLLSARAAQYAHIPGGDTGLLVATVKLAANGDTVTEYQVDAALLKEAREHEKQAAQELQQWTERHEVTGAGGGAIQVQYVNDWRNPDAE